MESVVSIEDERLFEELRDSLRLTERASANAHAEFAGSRLDLAAKRCLDVVVAGTMLILLSPLFLLIAAAIKLDSPGPVFYRCRRVGRGGSQLRMLKFRKMAEDASGPSLTVAEDARLTRVGKRLAQFKLDEMPQLWHVLQGEMSLVGPRPEDASFVSLYPHAYARIVSVPPGMTGLSQLAFAREGSILDPDDRLGHYIGRLLPQKVGMDELYVTNRTVGMDLRILFWTVAAVCFRVDVAVHRDTGRLGVRRRRRVSPAADQRAR